jgi:hypothetical protein
MYSLSGVIKLINIHFVEDVFDKSLKGRMAAYDLHNEFPDSILGTLAFLTHAVYFRESD